MGETSAARVAWCVTAEATWRQRAAALNDATASGDPPTVCIPSHIAVIYRAAHRQAIAIRRWPAPGSSAATAPSFLPPSYQRYGRGRPAWRRPTPAPSQSELRDVVERGDERVTRWLARNRVRHDHHELSPERACAQLSLGLGDYGHVDADGIAYGADTTWWVIIPLSHFLTCLPLWRLQDQHGLRTVPSG